MRKVHWDDMKAGYLIRDERGDIYSLKRISHENRTIEVTLIKRICKDNKHMFTTLSYQSKSKEESSSFTVLDDDDLKLITLGE